MNIRQYQNLYDSSIAYGMKHALKAETRRVEIDDKIRQLEKDIEDLEN